jgi:hypothetical protein
MTDLVTAMVARKHRLLHERDMLDHQISALSTAIDALNTSEMVETQRTDAAEKAATSPDAPPPQPEAVQPLPAPPAASPGRALGAPAPARTGKKAPPTRKDAAVPIGYNALIARAAEWGITEIHPDDLLSAVNAKAARLGLRPYALQSRSP